jgi:uncharacterized protein (TIGR00369 family)
MTDQPDLLRRIRDINKSAAFNRWAGFEVVRAVPGEVDLQMVRRPEHGQYTDFLHAGLIAALIDTACGFAAVTMVDRVLASHFSANCLAPAVGELFIAKGRVLRAGRKQFFTTAELLAFKDGNEKLVATGNALLVPLDGPVS